MRAGQGGRGRAVGLPDVQPEHVRAATRGVTLLNYLPTLARLALPGTSWVCVGAISGGRSLAHRGHHGPGPPCGSTCSSRLGQGPTGLQTRCLLLPVAGGKDPLRFVPPLAQPLAADAGVRPGRPRL